MFGQPYDFYLGSLLVGAGAITLIALYGSPIVGAVLGFLGKNSAAPTPSSKTRGEWMDDFDRVAVQLSSQGVNELLLEEYRDLAARIVTEMRCVVKAGAKCK